MTVRSRWFAILAKCMCDSSRSSETEQSPPKGQAAGSYPAGRAILVQVTAPHFCAAFVLEDETVIDAAPILKWSIGKRREWLRDYFRQKGWKAVVVVTER